MKYFFHRLYQSFKAQKLIVILASSFFFISSTIVYSQTKQHVEKKLLIASNVLKNLETTNISKRKLSKVSYKKKTQEFLTSKIENKELLKQARLRSCNLEKQELKSDFDFSSNFLKHDYKSEEEIGPYQVCHYVLSKPVFMDEENLKELIVNIEDHPIFPYAPITESPYCFFDFFSMKKVWSTGGDQVYQIFYELSTCQK